MFSRQSLSTTAIVRDDLCDGAKRSSFTADAIRGRKRFGAMMETDPNKIARGDLLYYKEAKAAVTFGVYKQEGSAARNLIQAFNSQLDAVLFMEELADKQHGSGREVTFVVERLVDETTELQ